MRFFDPTLGDMHQYNGELIGNLMGETLDVDVGPGEMAIGKFMRVKMSVAGPMMRESSITVTKEVGGRRNRYGSGLSKNIYLTSILFVESFDMVLESAR